MYEIQERETNSVRNSQWSTIWESHDKADCVEFLRTCEKDEINARSAGVIEQREFRMIHSHGE